MHHDAWKGPDPNRCRPLLSVQHLAYALPFLTSESTWRGHGIFGEPLDELNSCPSSNRQPHGGKGDRKFQRKIIDSKYPDFLNAAQRSLQQHFERPISWGLFEKELQKYLLETGHTPAYSTYITCVDPTGPEPPVLFDPRKYTAFNNRRVPFTISGIGGIPNAGLTGLRAITNQTPPGGRIVLVHGTHIGIDEFGSLGQSDIYDEASGIHLKIPSSEPVISTYKRLLTLNESEREANPHLDVGLHELQTVLRPHMETLKYTVDEPFIDLPKILYTEQRKRLMIAKRAKPMR